VSVTTSGPASAASFIKATYKVTGSTFLAGPKASVRLGPGTLSSRLNESTGALTATLSLPPATGSFSAGGIPAVTVTATTKFINDGPSTGQVNLNTGAVRTTSKVTLQITKLTVAGVAMPVGSRCKTVNPVVVNLKSLKGFNPVVGGKVAGKYTIGKFSHCMLATLMINQTVPASGNKITLKLGKPKIG